MRVIELLEYRKNPELNRKDPVEDFLLDILSNTKDFILPNIKNNFTSFTSIEKLGINPSSRYNTPIGIYAYPTEYVASMSSVRDVEFAGDSPFLNTFKVKGNIINISTMEYSELKEYCRKLSHVYHKISKQDESMSEMIINDLIEEGRDGHAKDKSIGGIFWYVLWSLSNNELQPYTKAKPPIIWNWLFRQIGIDGVVDLGHGIIHENEPTQSVFFSKESIYDIKRFNNTISSNEFQAQQQHDTISFNTADSIIHALNSRRSYVSLIPAINKHLLPEIKKNPNIIFDIRPYRLNDYIMKLYLKFGGDKNKLIDYKYGDNQETLDRHIDYLNKDIEDIKSRLKTIASTDPEYLRYKKKLRGLNKKLNLILSWNNHANI